MAQDRLLAMSVFAKVVEHGSFARAAERMDLSTSAVSRHVADLEAHLNTRLLNRTTRRISLTESGHAFYERTLQLLADLEEAEAIAASSTATPRGTIRLSCSINFGVRALAPAIGAFQVRHPEVLFDVAVSDRFVDLVEEGMDLAIRIGDIGNPNLIARRIGEIRLITCASPAYLKQHGTPRRPDELVRHNCLTYEYASARNVWAFRGKDGSDIKVRITGSVHGNNGELLAAIATEGIGICRAPDFTLNPLIRAGKLLPILKNVEPDPYPVYAVYPSRRHLSAKVRAFVDFLTERFSGKHAKFD